MEVAPLVDSVNDLLRAWWSPWPRKKALSGRRAHQLKTRWPAACRRLAQREGTSTELKIAAADRRSSIRATHTVNQLLALARAEGGRRGAAPEDRSGAPVVIDVVQDSGVPRAMDKQYRPLRADGTPAWGRQPTLLKELVRNLVDNAINYTPSGGGQPGMVTVRVPRDLAHVVLFQVGTAAGRCPRASASWCSSPSPRPGQQADGSGLGLPIVREIARQHGADVELEDARPGSAMPGGAVHGALYGQQRRRVVPPALVFSVRCLARDP